MGAQHSRRGSAALLDHISEFQKGLDTNRDIAKEDAMYAKEAAKRTIERLTGIGYPSPRKAASYIRKRKAWLSRFDDDGLVPNNPQLPFVHYRGALRTADAA